MLSSWSHEQKNEFKKSPSGNYGMVCGHTSDYLMCIDVDCKYDITGNLWHEYSSLIHEQSTILKDKCCIEKTINGGYHILFKCKTEIGNMKLASRNSTESELEKNKFQKKKVLIETRGKGGYFAFDPSPGYKIIHGDYKTIPYLHEEEMNLLLDTAKVFDEVVEIKKVYHKKEIDVSPFDDYNEKVISLDLLIANGWTEAKQTSKAVLLTRPGKTKGISASFLIAENLFYVFTSSSDFENSKAYNASQVYTILNHNGDYSEASKELIKEGFGTFKQIEHRQKIEDVPKAIDCILPNDEGLQYLYDLKHNRIPMGIDFGIPRVDEHLKFKYNQYVMFVGNTNVGKTTTLLYLLYRLANHKNINFKFLLYCAEDPISRIKRNLSQFYIKKPISLQTDGEILSSNIWINEHFKFFDITKRYSYVDILNVAEQVNKEWAFDSLLIDPYNSLKIDEQLNKTIRGWDYHVNASNEFQLWAHTKTGIIISAHTISSQQRLGSGSRPLLTHVEGGGMFSNKIDDGVVIHRMMDDEAQRRITQLYVDKIKDTYTGGMWTNSTDPVQLWMTDDSTAFNDCEPSNTQFPITKKVPF